MVLTIYPKSFVRELADPTISCSTRIQIDVSSAKRRTFFVRSQEMSLIYNKNKNGPSTDPWGPPELVDPNDEV